MSFLVGLLHSRSLMLVCLASFHNSSLNTCFSCLFLLLSLSIFVHPKISLSFVCQTTLSRMVLRRAACTKPRGVAAGQDAVGYPPVLPGCWVLTPVVFMEYWSISWWLFTPGACFSFKRQLYNKEQKYFSSLAKDDIWILMSVIIAMLIIHLQVIIPNDGHCLRESSGLTWEPIKPCFSGCKLSSLIFSKASTNGMF